MQRRDKIRGMIAQCTLGHFKKHRFDLWHCTRFSHGLVHLMPTGAILSKIDEYLDLPHRLRSFRWSVHTSTLAGMGVYLKVARFVQIFKTPGLIPLSDTFLELS